MFFHGEPTCWLSFYWYPDWRYNQHLDKYTLWKCWVILGRTWLNIPSRLSNKKGKENSVISYLATTQSSCTAWKVSLFGVIPVRLFPHYYVSFRVQSKCGKIRTRITPNTDIFHELCNCLWIRILQWHFSTYSRSPSNKIFLRILSIFNRGYIIPILSSFLLSLFE